MALIGIAAAAKLAGRDRRTIERYLASGALSCTTDATGKRVIDTSELARVCGPLSHIVAPVNVAVNSGVSQPYVAPVVPAAPLDDGEKAALRAHIGTLERQLDARTTEARELRAQVVGLLEWRRPDPVSPVPESSPVSRYALRKRDIAALLAIVVAVTVAASWAWQAGYRPWFML